MSQRTERIRESLEGAEPALEWLSRWYQVPVLATLLAFMLWVRTHAWKNFVTGDRVAFAGNDAWYHFRMVQYTVRNWPRTLPFDPWTSFPTGTSVGQFGTLFDQIIATAALLVGLGSPTTKQVALVHLFAPAVFGTLVAIPAYLLGRRLGGRFGGLVGVLVLALTPGQFLQRSLVGFSDHHIAETLFMTTAVLAVAVAVSVGEEEMPVYELFQTREWDALRRPLAWAALAGVAIGLYVWVWPPGMFLIGILGVFFALALALQYVRGTSPDHVAIVGAVAMTVTGMLLLIPMNTLELSATNFSFVQPLLAFLVAAGCGFVAATARLWDDRGLPPVYYPAALVGIVAAGVLVVAVAVPALFSFLQSQFLRAVGLGATATALTVAEAQPIPLDSAADFFRQSYGFAFLTALAGFALLSARVLTADRPKSEHVLVLVWSVFLVLATLTQRRFDYYLVVAVAVLNAYLVARVLGLVDAGEVDDLLDVKLYQVLAVLAIVVVVAVPLAYSGAGLTVVAASNTGPGEVSAWEGSLDWMADNTPQEGRYGGATNDLDYYGTFDRQEDFSYDRGQYGVIAWWDYGHWITVQAERIPFANPFQQGAREAANYLLSTNESEANARLVNDAGEETRYVMIDWKMADTSANLAGLLGAPARPKFSAPYAWENDVGRNDTDDIGYVFNTEQRTAFTLHRQSHYESMRVRLYQFHGSAIEPRPVVVDYREQTTEDGRTVLTFPQDGQAVRQFDNVSAARSFVEEDGSAQVGGLKGPYPSERVPALRHYRLVHASERSAFDSRIYQFGIQGYAQAAGVNPNQMFYTSPQWVKTFERVPGATVEGTGPPNATVRASVEMQMPNANTTFTYGQQVRTDENGEFTMTLPYSTSGYDQWGTDKGYTDVAVRAAGSYEFSAVVTNETGARTVYSDTTDVSEAHVIGENESAISVNLEETTVIPAEQADGNATDDGTADGDTSGDGGGNSSDSSDTNGANGSSALGPPGAPPAALWAGPV